MATLKPQPEAPPARESGLAGVEPLAGVGPVLRGSDSLLWRAALTRRGAVGLFLTGFVVLVAVIGPAVAPHSPTAFVTTPFAGPSGAFPLGSDDLGRDVLSRVLSGGWLILAMSLGAAVLGVGPGVVLGVIAGYVGGRIGELIMRAADIILAFPQLVFALLLVSVIGPRIWLIVLAVAATHVPQVTRVIRAATLDVAKRSHVQAMQLLRIPRWRIMKEEILPNLTSVIAVEGGLRMTWSILIITSLSFIGFGLQPPAANWGLMINENRVGVAGDPWGVIGPAIMIAILTVGLNTYTDAIARVSLGVEGRSGPEELGLGAGTTE